MDSYKCAYLLQKGNFNSVFRDLSTSAVYKNNQPKIIFRPKRYTMWVTNSASLQYVGDGENIPFPSLSFWWVK